MGKAKANAVVETDAEKIARLEGRVKELKQLNFILGQKIDDANERVRQVESFSIFNDRDFLLQPAGPGRLIVYRKRDLSGGQKEPGQTVEHGSNRPGDALACLFAKKWDGLQEAKYEIDRLSREVQNLRAGILARDQKQADIQAGRIPPDLVHTVLKCIESCGLEITAKVRK